MYGNYIGLTLGGMKHLKHDLKSGPATFNISWSSLQKLAVASIEQTAKDEYIRFSSDGSTFI